MSACVFKYFHRILIFILKFLKLITCYFYKKCYLNTLPESSKRLCKTTEMTAEIKELILNLQ